MEWKICEGITNMSPTMKSDTEDDKPNELEAEMLAAIASNTVYVSDDPRSLVYYPAYFTFGDYQFRMNSKQEGLLYKREKYLGKVRSKYHKQIGIKLYNQRIQKLDDVDNVLEN
jgi:hypothetical protein